MNRAGVTPCARLQRAVLPGLVVVPMASAAVACTQVKGQLSVCTGGTHREAVTDENGARSGNEH